MTKFEEFEQTQSEILAIERRMEDDRLRLRYLRDQQTERVREIRADAYRTELRTHSEEDVAKALEVSLPTMVRFRKAYDFPYLRVGSVVRYTDRQREQVIEAFTRGGKSRLRAAS